MNCEEFQSDLQDLLERGLELDVGPTHEHLAECRRCSRELADLIECRRLIAGLPEMDPPAGFSANVMASVREENRRKTPVRRLRVLTGRMPLQAAAVVLIAIISIFVYQREERNTLPGAAPEGSLSDGSTPAIEPQTPGTAVSGNHTPAPAGRVESVPAVPRQSASIESKPRGTPTPPAPSVAAAPRGFRGTSPLRAQGVVATMGPSAPAVLRDPGLRPFTGARGFPNLGEPVADYELIVRRRSSTQVEGEANAPEASEENSSASQPRLHSSSPVDIQWYVIAQDRYEHFKKEVGARATIESENAIGAIDRQGSFRADGPFYVKVLVLGPLDGSDR